MGLAHVHGPTASRPSTTLSQRSFLRVSLHSSSNSKTGRLCVRWSGPYIDNCFNARAQSRLDSVSAPGDKSPRAPGDKSGCVGSLVPIHVLIVKTVI
jgi:hypothetical protein